MIRVITYGTYDLLHHGHIRLLERAKALGDYLVVGITSDDYDKARGKINAVQSLIERIEAVRALNLADEIIVEEYEGQKIDDIRRLGIDIFTVGSDWEGHFDYLREYCKVIYLPRTEGVSSSEIRSEQQPLRIGFYGHGRVLEKYRNECGYVNGLTLVDACSDSTPEAFPALLERCEAVYIQSHPSRHAEEIRQALEAGKHVLVESPIALSGETCRELFALAEAKGLVLMDAIKTAYSTAYSRMLLLVKSGKIGEVVSVDATCTCLMKPYATLAELEQRWNARCAWAPAALLAVFQILGTDYLSCRRTSFYAKGSSDFDLFTKFDFTYREAVATVKVGQGVKSEGDLVISGTRGYLYVPAPWWKNGYFEIRYEDPADNQRYFYQFDGEGIRYELVRFLRAIGRQAQASAITQAESIRLATLIGETPCSL